MAIRSTIYWRQIFLKDIKCLINSTTSNKQAERKTMAISNCLFLPTSENPRGFSSGSFSFTNLDLVNATNHTQTR